MPAVLIEPTDHIDVTFTPVLIYGGPGMGKTSLAQTADNPITLDFDDGIHRSFNRKRAYRFPTWQDCVDAGEHGDFKSASTLVIDTGGRALDKMIPGILRENAKNGYNGALSPQGWGVLGNRFATWMKVVRAMGKEVVMLCHEEEAKNAGGNPYFLPDLPGKMSYKEIHKNFDLIGRIYYEGKQRFLDFSPCDNAIGKNAAQWERIELPNLKDKPSFLADLLADAKARIGKTAEQSASVALAVENWERDLVVASSAGGDVLAGINGILPRMADLPKAAKTQVWHVTQKFADAKGWEYDRANRRFVEKAKEGAA